MRSCEVDGRGLSEHGRGGAEQRGSRVDGGERGAVFSIAVWRLFGRRDWSFRVSFSAVLQLHCGDGSSFRAEIAETAWAKQRSRPQRVFSGVGSGLFGRRVWSFRASGLVF